MVQGVGFRPFVWKRANEFGLTGWVNNDSTGVTIEIQGSPTAIDRFLARFQSEAPPLSRIDSINVIEVDSFTDSQFTIRESRDTKSRSTPISADVSVCDDCLQEFNDSLNRRYHYPFTNCTNCGPRFTIVEDIPYDRPRTTMKSFPMCASCQTEYDDPQDRRFHAQPNACAHCGPCIWFLSRGAPDDAFESRPVSETSSAAAIRGFRTAIQAGQIIAVKGIGGFHLVCDATNGAAIRKLRQRKGRVDKPFAVMVRDVEQAGLFAIVNEHERQLLESKARPIVLLSKNDSARSGLQTPDPNVAPGNNFIGVLLPYSPLHYLLIDETPLVMTSGNISDEPIVRTNSEARQRLSKLADGFLLHDREIHVVCDDSVVRSVGRELLPIRRSRGYAPLPVKLSERGPCVLAVGGEIKSTFCLTKDDDAYLSQHIGDMENIETLDALDRSVEHFLRLFRADLKAVAADVHPGYLSGAGQQTWQTH